MPNIELYGYQDLDGTPTIQSRIKEALRTSPHFSEIAITTILSDVWDLTGKDIPFLRIIATRDELPDIKRRLAPLNQDIEVILLDEWIPKT